MAALSLYLLTFNCARSLIQSDVLAAHLFDALSPQENSNHLPEILVLSLQEISPIAHAFLGGSLLTPYYDAFRQAVDLAATKRGNTPYVHTITRNVGMTSIMVFVRQDVSERISWLETAEVGLGVQEMGNKGAVGVRVGYLVDQGEVETVDLTFVAAHLAPMEDAVARRNEDWKGIVQRLVFERVNETPDTESGENEGDENAPLLQNEAPSAHSDKAGIFSPTSHLFLAGDLNYRTSDTKPGREAHKNFPQPVKDPQDPMHWAQLLQSDQLTKELRSQKTLHGLREAPISFEPTYKYSHKTSSTSTGVDQERWQWAKHRWPSWCDRILYLDLPAWFKSAAALETHVYKALPPFVTSDHRAVALSLTVPLEPIPNPTLDAESSRDVRISPPFPLDSQWKTKRAAARRLEILVGAISYLGLTWEGNGLLLATGIGIVGAMLVLKAFLTS